MANTNLPISVDSEDITIRDCISLKFHINCCRLAFVRSFFLLPSHTLIVLYNHKLVPFISIRVILCAVISRHSSRSNDGMQNMHLCHSNMPILAFQPALVTFMIHNLYLLCYFISIIFQSSVEQQIFSNAVHFIDIQ